MKPVLDACCGPRMMWFNPKDSRALFMDCRQETVKGARGPNCAGNSDKIIAPDILADFTNMPFPNDTFNMVVFDPPHLTSMAAGATGIIAQSYGMLFAGWEEMLHAGFAECFRVLRPGGTLIFKWSEVEIPLARVLALTPEKPLFGNRSGRKGRTHWVAFLKPKHLCE